MKRERLQVQAHRIFGGEEPQNSIKAVERAAASRVDSIETDAWLSKDGKIYIMHGDNSYGECRVRPLNSEESKFELRTIGQLTSEELNSLTYAQIQGGPIPKLEDLLNAFKGTDKILNIEIKELDPKIVPLIIDQFESAGMLEQLFLSSFHHYHRNFALDHCKKKNLKVVPFGFLSYSIYGLASESVLGLTVPGDSLTLSYGAFRLHEHAFRGLSEAARERGLNINLWFDGVSSEDKETEETYRYLYDININTIITNHPSIALELVRSM